MDPTRFAAVSAALSERRSRRHALKLLAGGALGGALALGARTVPEARAVTAYGRFSLGWTHLAGTTTGLLFYHAGLAAYGTFVDGDFAQAGVRRNFLTDWTQI